MGRVRTTRSVLVLVAVMLVASLGDHVQAAAQPPTEPSATQQLLRSYNLPLTDPYAALLAAAAGRLAAAGQASGGPTTTQGVIDAAAADHGVYVKLTPHVLAVTMEALLTRTPTPDQSAFYQLFQKYYADHLQVAAIRTLHAWNEYRGTKVYPETIIMGPPQVVGLGSGLLDQHFAPPEVPRPPAAAPGPLSILIDTGKGVSGFQPPPSLLPLTPAAVDAVVELFGPLSLIEDAKTAEHPLAVGGDQTSAALAGLGLGVGIGSFAVGASVATVAGSAAALNAITLATVAAKAAVGNPVTSFTLLPLVGAAGGVSIAAGTLIIIPMLVGAGMTIAEVIKTIDFENALLKAAAKPDYEVEIRAIADPVYVQDAGLWYKDCPAGSRGVATRCYADCGAGYTDDGLTCRRDPHTIGKASFQRGSSILECRPGLVNDAGLCYPPCPADTRQVATRCYANCPQGSFPGSRLLRDVYRDDGLTCAKLLADFARPGYPWQIGDVPFDYSGTVRRCEADHGVGRCTLQGLIAYPNCPAGSRQTTVPFCTQTCPQGWGDSGVFCPKPFTDRGVGVPIDSCPAGSERLGALCYPVCAAGYSSPPGLPNTCLSSAPCPAGYDDTGFTCFRNAHIYGKGFTDRGVGLVNQPSAQDREVVRKAIFNYLVRMLVADPASGLFRPDGGPAQVTVLCSDGTVPTDELSAPVWSTNCPELNEAATIVVDRATVQTESGSSAQWDASASVSTSGRPLTFSWDFGDGTTATGATVVHNLPGVGTYRVVVTATDDQGRSSSVQLDVAVLSPGPSAAKLVALGPSTVLVLFTPGDVTRPHTITLDWGDGTTSVQPLPAGGSTFHTTHAYSVSGRFDVKAVITDDQGLRTEASTVVAT